MDSFQGVLLFQLFMDLTIIKFINKTNQKTSIRNLLKGRGLFSTFLRESIAMSRYFGTYHKARDNGFNSFVSGGISGLANWTLFISY